MKGAFSVWGELKIPVVVPLVLQITHQRDSLSLSISVAAAQVKKKVHNILSPKCVENLF